MSNDFSFTTPMINALNDVSGSCDQIISMGFDPTTVQQSVSQSSPPTVCGRTKRFCCPVSRKSVAAQSTNSLRSVINKYNTISAPLLANYMRFHAILYCNLLAGSLDSATAG